MKYRVNLPIVNLVTFEVIVDAEDKDEASDLAEAFYDAWCEDPLSKSGPLEFEDDSGKTHIGQFVEFDSLVDSWIGDDIYVIPADANASERASVASEQQDVQTT